MRPYPPAVVVLGGGAPNGAMTAGAWRRSTRRQDVHHHLLVRRGRPDRHALHGAKRQRMGQATPAEARPDAGRSMQVRHRRRDLSIVSGGLQDVLQERALHRAWIPPARNWSRSEIPLRRRHAALQRPDGFRLASTCPTSERLQPGPVRRPPSRRTSSISTCSTKHAEAEVLHERAPHRKRTMIEFGPKNSTNDAAPTSMRRCRTRSSIHRRDRQQTLLRRRLRRPAEPGGARQRHREERIKARTVVIVDVLSTIESSLVRVPKDLWDAFGISIMLPVVSLAEKNQEIFALRMDRMERDACLAGENRNDTLQFESYPRR